MKKKILFSLLILSFCITLVGCGDKKEQNKSNNDENNKTTNTEIGLGNVSITNYKTVVKNLFGIDIIDTNGWEIETAESPNKVNNLNLDYDITSSGNGKDILKQYYNKVLEVSSDGVYSYGFNDSYQVVKETKYNSFDEVYNTSSSYGSFHQISFIYSYNGRNIQFSMTIDESLGNATISFVYC